IHGGEISNIKLLLAGWPQDTISYSNRFSHMDAAGLYHDLKDDYDGVRPHVVRLQPWDKKQTEEFLKKEFDIQTCSPLLVKFIYNKTGGVPGLAKALVRDRSLVFVKNGGQLDCPTIERLGDICLGVKDTDIFFPIPQPIQSYVTKMVDALVPYENSQFILITVKVMQNEDNFYYYTTLCVGQEFLSIAFALDSLRACHPLNDSETFEEEFKYSIEVLEEEEFIREGEEGESHEGIQSGRFYVFNLGLLRDVIYTLMLFKQRSAFHKSIIKVFSKLKKKERVMLWMYVCVCVCGMCAPSNKKKKK
ncbi:hypothetical protein RFI_13174, partial [Reticulomyxa filosa]